MTASELSDPARSNRWQPLIDVAGKDLIDPEVYKQQRGWVMAEVAEELLPIDTTLRFALFGLECALGVTFNAAECERVFRDATVNQMSSKQYVLFESSRFNVSGRVDEYEPESIWLRVQGELGVVEKLKRGVEGSRLHAIRLSQLREIEEHG